MGKELVSFLTSTDPGAEEAWNGAALSERMRKLWRLILLFWGSKLVALRLDPIDLQGHGND
jgi:hypothetical protein